MYELNKHPLSLGYCKMAELEGLEEKLSAIWYIETPTHFTSGLGNLTKICHISCSKILISWGQILISIFCYRNCDRFGPLPKARIPDAIYFLQPAIKGRHIVPCLTTQIR